MIKAFAKKLLFVFLRFGISAVLLLLVFRQVDEKSLFEIVKSADKPLLFSSLAVYLLTYALCIYRWSMLLGAVGIRIPITRIIISYSGGVFFSLFLPSTIGGDVMRSVDMAAHTKKTKEVLATVFVDRLSGYIGLVILTIAALLCGWRLLADPGILLPVAIITLLLILVLLVFFDKASYKRINKMLDSPTAGRLRELITNLHHEIHIFRDKIPTLTVNIIISVIIQMVTPVTFYLISLSLGLKIDILYFFIFLPIIGAITLLPISIGGLGLRDATVVYFFAKVGVARDPAFAMSLLNFSFIVLYGAIGGLIYVLTVHHRRLQHNPQPHLQPEKKRQSPR